MEGVEAGEAEVEHPLAGGNFDGDVVRVGDTVRRRAGPWTPAVHALLRHLDGVGFAGAPSAHGMDERGREVLDFIDGDVGRIPMDASIRADAVLVDVGRMLRALHDATTTFAVPEGAVWRQAVSDPGPIQVVCHSDWAPYNAVFRGGRLSAFVDWDFARPGSRVWDLAWAAHTWVPLRDDRECASAGWPAPPDRAHRLRLLCDAYGLGDRRGVLQAIRARVQGTAEWIEAGAAAGEPVFVRLLAEGHAQGYRRAASYLDGAARELGAALL
jgi:aminoglycoside phosphotransferase (APT) family kinase protein